MGDPDRVAIGAHGDALVNERLGRAVEGGAVAQVAVEWHAALARVGIVEASRRQRPARSALLGEALSYGADQCRVGQPRDESDRTLRASAVRTDQCP